MACDRNLELTTFPTLSHGLPLWQIMRPQGLSGQDTLPRHPFFPQAQD